MNTLDNGRYTIMAVLGRREYSTVYQAVDVETGTRVAVKCLNLDAPRRDIARAMFRKEVESLEHLEHPAVIKMLRRFEEDERLGIVLELVPGGRTLQALIEDVRDGRSEPHSLQWSLEQLRRLLGGLEAAHRRHIIHRDVKPSNVLIDSTTADLRLADFGVAQVMQHYASGTAGTTLREFYSRPYAAPEQVLGYASTFASDMHAFGVLACALLGWVLPDAEFRSHHVVAVLDPLFDEMLETPARQQLVEVLSGLVHDQPAMRPRVADVERALRAAIEGAVESETVPVIVTPSALSKAKTFLVADEAALLADLNQGLRGQYRPGQDRDGKDSYTIRCYGKSVSVLLRPDNRGEGGLVMVDAGRAPPAQHLRQRELGTSVLVTLVPGEGNAERLIEPCYAAFLALQERAEEAAQADDLFRIAQFVLQKERERLTESKVRYRLVESTQGGPSNRPIRFGRGAVVKLEMLNVQRAGDVEEPESIELLAEKLGSQTYFAVEGRSVGKFQEFDRAKRILILRTDASAKLPREGFVHISDVASATSLKRQDQALDRLRAGDCVNPKLALLLAEPKSNRLGEMTQCSLFQALQPTEEMLSVVERALAAKDIFLLQGPPGTGKTTLIAEFVAQLLRRDPSARILLTSQANDAVNNALDGLRALAKSGGHTWRLLRDIPERGGLESVLSLDVTFRDWADRTRSLSAHALEKFASGEPPNLTGVTTAVRRWVDGLESIQDVRHDYAQTVNVFGATCLRVPALRKVLREVSFDWVIVDEAAKATPSEVLVSLSVGKRFILVGDHLQLPPFLDRQTEADVKKAGLDVARARRSLFEELFAGMPTTNRHTLRRQYRMHRSIGKFVGDLYYAESGGLITEVSDDARQLALPSFGGDNRVFWLDVVGRERPAGTSWWNEEEIAGVRRLLESFEATLAGSGTHYVVGVIAPYVAQVGRLRSALQSFKKHAVAVHLEINTVDAFQGREVDILLYSLVRVGTGDNPFIGDARRLNVAFSRAKRLLVVIGHRASAETNANLARALRLIPEENFLAVESIK